jgi:hypothetical protein
MSFIFLRESELVQEVPTSSGSRQHLLFRFCRLKLFEFMHEKHPGVQVRVAE